MKLHKDPRTPQYVQDLLQKQQDLIEEMLIFHDEFERQRRMEILRSGAK